MRRRDFVASLCGAAGFFVGTHRGALSQPATLSRIGWLKIQDKTHTPNQLIAFTDSLRALGQADGQNILLEARYADGDNSKLQSLAEDLLRVDVKVIVATSQPALDAAYRVTQSVPIVARMTDDPVKTGKAQSLAHPAGNVTGVYSLLEQMTEKRLDLLRQALPALRRVGALLTLDRGDTAFWLSQTRQAAQRLGIDVHVMNVRTGSDLEPTFQQANREGVDGILAFRNPTIVTFDRRVAELANRYRMPSIFDSRDFVDSGALMSYGPNLEALFRRLGGLVDIILKGKNPADIPIEQPTTFELVINRQTAKEIGLDIPPTLLALADEVIE